MAPPAGNSPDFAAALAATDDCSDDLANFAFKYAGRTIEFDGAIAAMTNHEGAKTRFDILVVAGDSPAGTRAPNFQFRDVNMTDLRLTGSVPPSLGVGNRLRVTATIAEYSRNSCLLFLKPVSTEVK